MDIPNVLNVKHGFIIAAQLVDKSLEILGAYQWRSWQSHLNCLAGIIHWDVLRYFHTKVNLSMRFCATSDPIVAHTMGRMLCCWRHSFSRCPSEGPSQGFSLFRSIFLPSLEAFQLGMAPVYMPFLRFMGEENEARTYYSLKVGGYGRKRIWEGAPRSIRDNHDGLIIQRNMALFFFGGNRKELKLRATGRKW